MSEEEEERKKNNLPVLLVPGLVLSQWFVVMVGVLLAMKILEDDWYVVIKAYKCTVSEIWRDFIVLAYIACPTYRVYRLCDMSMYVKTCQVSLPGPIPHSVCGPGYEAIVPSWDDCLDK